MSKILKNMGYEREEKVKRSKHSRKQKCKQCKCTILIDSNEVLESTYRVANKVFYDCLECGSQIHIK